MDCKIPPNVRKALTLLIPTCIIKEMACFAFYDKHPQDTKSIDVVICTRHGEIQEIFNRKMVSSYLIEKISTPIEIKMFRNKKAELFYLVIAGNDLIILSRKEQITLLRKINNVGRYEIEDVECTGNVYLKIHLKDDAMPVIIDENFECVHIPSTDKSSNESIPLIISLNRKLTEAKYCVHFNQNKYEEYVKLYQNVAFNMYQKTSKLSDTLVRTNFKELSNLFQIGAMKPQIRVCNKKVVIIVNISNKNSFCLENVCLILHMASKKSLIYTSKLYENLSCSPYWKEIKSQMVKANSEVFITAVIEWKEFQYFIQCNIELDVLLAFEKEGKANLLPFEKIKITAEDILGQDFDVFSSKTYESHTTMLCVLTTTESTKLHIQPLSESKCLNPSQIFEEHLKMTTLTGLNDVFVHTLSPHHELYGVLIMFSFVSDNTMEIKVFSRCTSQTLALIGLIHDVVPQRLVITPANCKVECLVKDMLKIDNVPENTISKSNCEHDFMNLSASVIKQTSIIREYLDRCMIKMNETKNALIQDKIGMQIDLVAQGLPRYLEFREKMLEEIQKGLAKEVSNEEDIEFMLVDN